MCRQITKKVTEKITLSANAGEYRRTIILLKSIIPLNNKAKRITTNMDETINNMFYI